jgi:hypothetical protein
MSVAQPLRRRAQSISCYGGNAAIVVDVSARRNQKNSPGGTAEAVRVYQKDAIRVTDRALFLA